MKMRNLKNVQSVGERKESGAGKNANARMNI
jgi:hypothetical protein